MTWLPTLIEILIVPAIILSAVKFTYLPLSMAAAGIDRSRTPGAKHPPEPLVSVIVPAFNEAAVLARCIDSILAEAYPRVELILIDDGSTDDTWQIMAGYRGHPRVLALRQDNAGKAAALNRGLASARGDIVMFVDADGLFTGDTISAMVRPFADPRVGAVCGNDAPVNLDRMLPRLLCLLTHLTAMARRALALVNCLTIVSGNCGAVRATVVRQIGPFAPGLLGEDLELTWRVREAGHRVAFAPAAIVYAEVPSTLSALWAQRVRWARGYLETLARHRRLVGSVRHGVLGPYLVLNVMGQVLVPLLQLVVTAGGAVVLWAMGSPWQAPALWVVALAIGYPLVCVATACCLGKGLRDLRFVPVLAAMPFYSIAMCVVLVVALRREVARAPAAWNKFARTGVVSRAQP